MALAEHQQDLIATYEKQVEQTILQGVQVILPEFVDSIEDIDVCCEAAVSNLIMETTRHSRKRLAKRPNEANTSKKKKPAGGQ